MNEPDASIEELLSLRRDEPRAELRERVLTAVRSELCGASSPRPRDARREARDRWTVSLSFVALVVLWMHVAWSAALQERLDYSPDDSAELASSVEQFRELFPELSDEVARGMTWRLRRGSCSFGDSRTWQGGDR